MSDGMGRELAYLSSHATNRYFIPNWGKINKNYGLHQAFYKSCPHFSGMFCTQKSPDSIGDVRKTMSVRRQLSESKTEKF